MLRSVAFCAIFHLISGLNVLNSSRPHGLVSNCGMMVNNDNVVTQNAKKQIECIARNDLNRCEKVFIYNNSVVEKNYEWNDEISESLRVYEFDENGRDGIHSGLSSGTDELPNDSCVLLFADDIEIVKTIEFFKKFNVGNKNIKLFTIWCGNSNVSDENLDGISLLPVGDDNKTLNYEIFQILLNEEIKGIQQYALNVTKGDNIRLWLSGNVTKAELLIDGRVINLLDDREVEKWFSPLYSKLGDNYQIILPVNVENDGILRLDIDAKARASFKLDKRSVYGRSEALTQYEIQKINNILPPLTIDVGTGSELLLTPNRFVNIYFEVTNNQDKAVTVNFACRDEMYLLQRMNPRGARIEPRQTIIVTVELLTRQQTGFYDKITFSAHGNAYTEKIAYVYVNNEKPVDTEGPNIWYTFTSDCFNVLTTSCDSGNWAVDIYAQDKETGLMQLMTNPRGIYFPNNFISGTKDQVNGFYTASCCNSQLQITAVDLYGNRRILELNPYIHAPLSAGIIAAIVLGIILLLLLIGGCVYCLIRRRRNQVSVHLPSYSGPSGRGAR